MKDKFYKSFFILMVLFFFSWVLQAQVEKFSPPLVSISPIETTASAYEDLICNGWIYDFVSSFTESCIVDTTLVDTMIIQEFEIGDTTFLFVYELYLFQIKNTCYDYSFGVVEDDSSFEHYYYSSTITFFDIIHTEMEASLNGTPLPVDSLLIIMEEANLLVEDLAVGFKATVITDCLSLIGLVCINDSICYNALNEIHLSDTIYTEDLQLDTIGYVPNTQWEFIELWNFIDQNQADCDDSSNRINPCDTCEAQLITKVEILPDTCQESELSIALHGEFDYEFCSLNNVEINYNLLLNEINLLVNYTRADTFEFCTECGTVYGDTILIGTLNDDIYTLNVINSFNDSVMLSTTFEVIDCYIPFCQAPEPVNLNTESITNSSAVLSYLGNTVYYGFTWRYRVVGVNTWTTGGTSVTTSKTLENLTPCTDYEWQVNMQCDNGLWTGWFGDSQFTTQCNVQLLFEDFNDHVNEDDIIQIPIQLVYIGNLLAFQFSIHWDTTFLEYVQTDVNETELEHFSSSNIGTGLINNGIIVTSWSSLSNPDYNQKDSTILFTLDLSVKNDLCDSTYLEYGISSFEIEFLDMNLQFLEWEAHSAVVHLNEENCTTSTVDNDELDFISLFPNPSNDYIHIRSAQEINNIRILNSNGIELINTNLLNNIIDISSLPLGLYFIEIESNNKTLIKKIIKI